MKASGRENGIEDILDLILSTFGMNLPETHYGDVTAFVRKRMEERGENISRYIQTLSGDRDEYIRFIDAITINESYFFRDIRHFTLFYNEILLQLFEERRHVKIWSAAAAAGEEALSLAALCNNVIASYPDRTYSIYASDINAAALGKLREGTYTRSAFREDGAEMHSFLRPYITEKNGFLNAEEAIRERIIVEEHNLFHDDYSAFPDDFDLVLLRNVFIYMPMENRNRILHRIVSKIRDGGYLFLSASEVPLVWHPTLKIEERRGVYFFRRSVPETGEQDLGINRPEEQSRQKKNGAADDTTKRDGLEHGASKEEPVTRELYEVVNHLLYNPLFEKEENRTGMLAEIFVSLIAALNAGDITRCADLITALQTELGDNEAVLYYRGMLEKIQEKGNEGIEYFQKALQVHQQFWPARYERAMLLKRKNREKARQQFALCRRHIQLYIEKGEYTYHFLLDGFNALYFLKICTFWEQKLGGSVHGAR